jgi:hypothetical protein
MRRGTLLIGSFVLSDWWLPALPTMAVASLLIPHPQIPSSFSLPAADLSYRTRSSALCVYGPGRGILP